jgi:hypothetical protein
VVLADRRAETAVAAVIEVEQAIYNEFRVRDVSDAELVVGDWFSADVLDMTYGVQLNRPLRGTVPMPKSVNRAAVFTAEMPGLFVLLSGSAEYLLDRPVPQADAGDSMSYPQAIMSMLMRVTEDSNPDVSSDSSAEFARSAIYAAHNLHQEFAFFGLHPLRFLARTISILESEQYADPLILGTPLFVEFAQSD